MPGRTDPTPSARRIVASSRGRLAGTDFHEAVVAARGELGSPHRAPFPELSERGFAATRTARTVSCLAELFADGQPFGWRLTSRPSHESVAASSRFRSDINVLADVIGGEGSGHQGSTVVSLTGPVSLAADLGLSNGEAVLSDHGARRELAESLTEGVAALSEALRTAVEDESLVIRWLEPHLERALAGRIPTSSGYRTLRAVPRAEADRFLSDLAAACDRLGIDAVLDVDGPLPDPEFGQHFHGVAARPLGRGSAEWEGIAGVVDKGQEAWLGITDVGDEDRTVDTVRSFWRTWRDLGLGAKELSAVTIEEADDLAGLSPLRGTEVHHRSATVAEGLLDLSRE